MSEANVEIARRVYEGWSRGGAEVSAQTATVWTFEAGKVVRLALYWDVALATEAAQRQA